ncbi:hypothetical protein BGZ93_004450 [Podila epicladia]|nr:hypothetical protein BGZ92_006413 [Podila epicladia]KAG0100073.1 hypothetical protein BGZ93_004450 [Podila epicladia]
MKPDEISDLTESENPDRMTQVPASLESLNPAEAMVASLLRQASTAETVSSSDLASKDTESEPLWINNERDEASKALRGWNRQLRNMFETLYAVM